MSQATITDSQLTFFRELGEQLMINTGTITRPSEVRDTAGGWTVSESTIATNVPCRVTVRTRTWVIQGIDIRSGGVTDYLEYVVKVAWDTDLEPQDFFTVDDVKYLVEAVWGGHDWRTVKRAKIVKVH